MVTSGWCLVPALTALLQQTPAVLQRRHQPGVLVLVPAAGATSAAPCPEADAKDPLGQRIAHRLSAVGLK